MKAFLFIPLALLIIGFALTVDVAIAAEALKYEPVVKIPGLDPNTQGTDQYVRALYLLSITAAALLAVVKIIFGGVKWMLSDVVTSKESAKKDIWGAVFGLLIVLSAALVLQTINPNLLKLNFLSNADPIPITLQSHKTLNACEKDAESAACCQAKGGQYVVEDDGKSHCNEGEDVNFNNLTGENLEADRAECIHKGMNWNSITNKCTTQAAQEMPLPPSMQGETDVSVLTAFCVSLGNDGRWSYRDSTRTCIYQ